MIQVEKRNGSLIDFDSTKIQNAISKANADVEYGETPEMSNIDIEYMTCKVVEQISSIDEECQYCINVEEIQDIVEATLAKMFPRTAKKYILYREHHRLQRDAIENLMRLNKDLLFTDSEDMDLKRDNANINTDAPMGIMLKLGTENSKMFLNNYVLPEKFREMHAKHIQHLHDADFSLVTFNCLYSDLAPLLENGFNTGHGFIRPPRSIRAAASLACVSLQSSQNDCFGGQSLIGLDYVLAPYVDMSFKKHLKNAINTFNAFNAHASYKPEKYKEHDDIVQECLDIIDNIKYYDPKDVENREYMKCKISSLYEGSDLIKTEKIYNIACKTVEEETHQAMEALVFNLNTLHSRCGSQVPFSSVNLGMNTTPEGRLIIKEFLNATWNGLGNGETPLFPISVWLMKEGVNYNPGDPNYDLFKYAMKVSAKRLYPNFLNIDSSFNLPYYKADDYRTHASAMGCRTRVMSNVNGPEITSGRGNFAFTTINLPYLALQACRNLNRQPKENNKEVIDEFFKLFDKYIYLGKEYLEWRFNIIAKKEVKNFPFVMGQHLYMGSEKLGPTDEIRPALLNASISIGYVGLAECLVALTGKHHGESKEAQELGLSIVKHLRDATDNFTEETHLNWSTFATPAEGFAGTSLRGCRAEFGIIPGITDREYLTNSHHCPVYYQMKAIDKIKTEAPYNSLANAGSITYIEMDGDPLKNLPAFEKLVRAMHDNDLGYYAISHAVDRDPICGYTGIIANECPHCHRREDGRYRFKVKKYENND